MSTATVDPQVEETTPVTAVENEVLVGTPQPIHELDEEAQFQALLREEELAEDPIESYSDPVHEPQIAPEPIGEVMDLPTEQPPPADVEKPEPTKAELLEMLSRFQSELEKLRNGASTSSTKRQVASGSKARPNVLYTLLSKPNSWHNTPQVAQLQGLLFDPEVAAKHTKDGAVQMTEPELFAILEEGKAAGKLRTKQPAVRIFQYYRNELLNSNTLRWQ